MAEGGVDVPPEVVEQDESSIRAELGIAVGKVNIDQATIDKLLADAVVGYENIFSDIDFSTGPTSPMSALAGGGGIVDQNLGLLKEVHMKVKVELGRGRMYLKDILRLGQGSVVELERLAGDPLDIFVNEKVIARGEVLVLNENFCIRITEICRPEELLSKGA